MMAISAVLTPANSNVEYYRPDRNEISSGETKMITLDGTDGE